ncbi:MAG: hypothetical protein WBA89_11005 [Microcoleus sp.]|uniref:hypothetical protein n=1 Tax=Microcoleus sp. TaxID=44472 RepID=UPI003C71ADD0
MSSELTITSYIVADRSLKIKTVRSFGMQVFTIGGLVAQTIELITTTKAIEN